MKKEGCVCQGCGRIYGIDLIIPDDLWEGISPKKVEGHKGGGLLCGACIMSRLEEITDFDYWYVTKGGSETKTAGSESKISKSLNNLEVRGKLNNMTRFKLQDPVWLVNLQTKQQLQASIISVCETEDSVEYSVRLTDPGWTDLVIQKQHAHHLMGSDGLFGGDGVPLRNIENMHFYDEAEDGTLPDLEMLRIAMERLGFKRDGSIYELGNNVGWFTAWMEHRCTMLKWTGDKENWKDELCDGPTAKHIIEEVKNVMAANQERTI